MRYNKEQLKEKSLLALYPEIAKEWRYRENRPLRPENVAAHSHKKVWWKCEKNHKWQATISSRTRGHNGCPICSNRVVLQGFNDLETLDPETAKLWNYEKNGDLKPSQVSIGCNKRVWWKCEKGHEYQLKVNDKARKKHGCPICSNRIIIKGYNDLETLRPDLAGEWDKWMNKLKPSEVALHANKKIWWVCYQGHHWEASINDRTRKSGGTNCPYCARKRRWNPIKNDDKNL